MLCCTCAFSPVVAAAAWLVLNVSMERLSESDCYRVIVLMSGMNAYHARVGNIMEPAVNCS